MDSWEKAWMPLDSCRYTHLHLHIHTHTHTCIVGDSSSFPPAEVPFANLLRTSSSLSSIEMFLRRDKKFSNIMSSESTSSLNQTIPQRLTVASVAKRKSWTSNIMRTWKRREERRRGREGKREGEERGKGGRKRSEGGRGKRERRKGEERRRGRRERRERRKGEE